MKVSIFYSPEFLTFSRKILFFHVKTFWILLSIFLVSFSLTFAGTTGKISGIVKDARTGNSLPGANVVIEGTNFGAAADVNGKYFIINIPPGKYNVVATVIGYKKMIVENVKVISDFTTTVDFDLEPTVIEAGETVVVTAERPLIQKDITATTFITLAEEIDNMPVNSYTEILNLTAGIIENNNGGGDNGIHIRGGRSGEIAYMVDGFFVEDAIYGGMGTDVSRTGISELSVITGTFNAEYGEAMSGVVNIITKEGAASYTGSFRASTDRFMRLSGKFKKDPPSFDFGTRRFEASFGGPVPGLRVFNSTMFVSGDILTTGTYLWKTKHDKEIIDPTTGEIAVALDGTLLKKPHYHHNKTYLNRNRLNTKLVFKPFSSFKVVVGGVFRRQEQRQFSISFKEIPEHRGIEWDNSDLYTMTINHTLSPKTFYTLKFSQFKNWSKYGLNKPDNEIISPLRVNNAFGNTSNYEFWGQYTIIDTAGNEIKVISDDDFKRDYSSITKTLGGSITSQISDKHQIKIGAEYKLLKIQNDWINGVNSANPEEAHYVFWPKQAEFYIQDKMEFEDMIVNLGLRLDYLNPRSRYVADPLNPLAEKPMAKVKWHLSPRLGFGYPATDRILFHFAYGQFFQNPEYFKFYRRTNQQMSQDNPLFPYNLQQGYIPTIGNPNLNPETTTAYEFGVEALLTRDMVVDFTLYYKDIYDYVTSTIYDADPTQYAIFENADYGNSKGIEVSLRKRFSHNFSGNINYTYSRAEGNAAYEYTHWYEAYMASVYGTYPARKTITMPWDQPHTLTFALDIREPDDWGINIIGNMGSGLPYTPRDSRGRKMDETNSGRMPPTSTLDVRINKDFSFKGLKYRLFADITNLLDKKNVLNVFDNSGQPDQSTNPNASIEWQDRPHYFGPPRHIEIGLDIRFD
ncbi:MAG: TonB-dependent receptor domain-containing protein [Fidelibacterota bacterium]